ncbi:UDP-N-acetylglucosamine diphosphorylase/glucosamine-1-phosphate N-acetyltransferase [Methanomethylovorans hollandica DSM 15978]|uniref:Bifunctional protein GlmU n=1 Tax=Methanomethylovorans hollandica (strain DSM 15978 / NBRC 107637 / DMS1) TaxID=867904 RepID=L0KZA7_METHD|nr:bifunctional sugar-1-phosphate nucleotidylyltransferase/acetyltransferase [Methanomethylovorans hollandica]AGB50030.1 UDP-N-acetylglucosamine diphosphorylase/glucosamine-1-phosphate N-acetyltransferase [Methanomethylovorans hollandica DSM 15978]
MKAVILAAGEGLRCRPLTLTRSKVMLPVADRPILEHVISSLEQNDIKDILLIVGYEKERIMDYFRDGVDFGVNIRYVEQKTQLGTAHAIEQAKNELAGEHEFLALNGDNFIEPKVISDLIRSKRGDATILAVKTEHVSGYGVLRAEDHKVLEILENPVAEAIHLVNTGIYYFSSKVFDYIGDTPLSLKGEYAITDTLQKMIESGTEVSMATTRSWWLDAVYAWDLLRLNSVTLGKIEKNVPSGAMEDGAHIKGNVSIGKNTIVRSGCYIVGPVLIGENCDIGPNAVILPSTSIGNNVSVGAFTNIRNSIIMNDVRMGSHGYVSDSVIGSNCHIGPYFITETDTNLSIIMNGELQRAEKLGTIIGDDTDVGHRVLVKAGVIISINCHIGSGNVVDKALHRGTLVL